MQAPIHRAAAAQAALRESGLFPQRFAAAPVMRDVIADRGYRGLAALAARKHLGFHIKAPPKGGGWRRLSRFYEGTEASARPWLEVVCVV